jgi:tetratricopeptide (TPR) repeat protein
MRTGRTPNDCIFLCFERNGAGLDLAQVGRNLEFARKSGNVRIPAPEIIAQLVVHDDLGAFLPPGPLQTDDRPLLEYRAPRRLHQIGRQELLDHITASERASGALAEARRRQGNVAGQLQLADFLVSVDSSPFGLVDVERANPEEKARYAELLREHARRTGLVFAKAGPWEQSVCVPAQEAAIRQRLAESAGTAGPTRAAALLGLGNHRILAKDYAEGSRLLEEAVALLPHHDPALRSLQSAHELSGRYEAAANVVRRRMENGVKTPLLLSGLAYYLGRLGGDRAAWVLVEQALALDPDAPQALVVGANLLMERQELGRAVEFARRATRAAPQEATTHVTLVRALLQAERTAEARTALVWGLAQCPGDPELLRLQQQPEKPGNGRLPAPAPGNFR